MIKQIECFCAKLHAYLFIDPSRFRQRQVNFEKPRANQSISPEITEEAGTLKRKSRWIVPLIYPPNGSGCCFSRAPGSVAHLVSRQDR